MKPPAPPEASDAPPADGPDPTLAALYRRALAPREPDAERLQRVRAQLARAPELAAPPRARRSRPGGGLVAAGLLVAGLATAAWVVRRDVQPGSGAADPLSPRLAPAVATAPAETTGDLGAAPRALPRPPAPATAEPRLRPARPRPDETTPARRPLRRMARVPLVEDPAPVRPVIDPGAPTSFTAPDGDGSADGAASTSPIADESRRLALVYTQLRRLRDADEALAEIRDYLRLYPDGVLVNEARLAEIDALLMKGQTDQALIALTRIRLGNDPRELELRLIRGELRARRDCRAALTDLGAVLSARPREALQERALRSRATCDLRLGDRAAARMDLGEYLRRFPDSRHAASARAQLEAMPLP